MKKQLLLFAMILLPLVASAHDIEVQNADGVTIYYNYINDGKELAVTFRGNRDDSYWDEYQGNVAIPEEVTYMNRTRKVTSIGEGAFCNCSGLTSVTIPNSVTSIGGGAFYLCSRLISVTIPNSVTSIGTGAFAYCAGLISVTIPNSVTSLGERAFQLCFGLTSVTIGSGVTSMGYNAFEGADIPTVISLIENPFTITGKTSSGRVFTQNTFNNATLYVPKGTIGKYKATGGWKDFLFIEEGITNGIANIPAQAVLIQSEGGSIKVQGVDEGAQVNVYSINGTQAGTTISQNGAAIVNTNLQPGSIAIVKIGEKTVKVVVR